MTISSDMQQLNQQFSYQQGSHSLSFKLGAGDIPVVEIHNQQASAVISLQGAQVLSWIPKGEAEVIWLSADASFAGPGLARTVFWSARRQAVLEECTVCTVSHRRPGPHELFFRSSLAYLSL